MLFWSGNFESGDLTQWSLGDSIHTNRMQVVDSPVREGAHALRIELHPGDLGPSNLTRAELTYHPDAQQFENTEHYYAWSAMISPDNPVKDTKRHELVYWESDGAYIDWHLTGEDLAFGFNGDLWTGKLAPGAWHDFVFHVMWSRDKSVGFVEFWFDGKKVVNLTKGATLNASGQGGEHKFMHQGLLSNDPIDTVQVIFYDGMKDGTTEGDVLPGPLPEGGVGVDRGVDAGRPSEPDTGMAGAIDASSTDAPTTVSQGTAGSGSGGGVTSSSDAGPAPTSAGATDDSGCSCRLPRAPTGSWRAAIASLVLAFAVCRRTRR
jgi:Polysaccharide lyase